MYAIVGFIFAPDHVTTVDCEFWYLDEGEIREKSYTRRQALTLRKKWEKKTKKMLSDTTFAPTPSADACHWCHFKKAKGGPCKF